MWTYDKKLQYPVKITKPNPAMAKVIITQFGGPDGELAASQRYLAQRYSAPYDETKAILTDIGRSAAIGRFFSPEEPGVAGDIFSGPEKPGNSGAQKGAGVHSEGKRFAAGREERGNRMEKGPPAFGGPFAAGLF